MKILKRKNPLDRLLDSVSDALELPDGVKSKLPRSGKPAKAGLLTAGGLATLTAASAGISSLRRRSEGTADGS